MMDGSRQFLPSSNQKFRVEWSSLRSRLPILTLGFKVQNTKVAKRSYNWLSLDVITEQNLRVVNPNYHTSILGSRAEQSVPTFTICFSKWILLHFLAISSILKWHQEALGDLFLECYQCENETGNYLSQKLEAWCPSPFSIVQTWGLCESLYMRKYIFDFGLQLWLWPTSKWFAFKCRPLPKMGGISAAGGEQPTQEFVTLDLWLMAAKRPRTLLFTVLALLSPGPASYWGGKAKYWEGGARSQ